MGIVFQRHRVNNDSTLTWSRDNWRLLSARLLWEFSRSRVASEVSHACCCGVCPFRALSLPLSLSRYLSPSVFSPTPFLSVSLALHLQSASVVSADCWTVGEEGYREYWSFGESLWKMAPVVTGWVWNSGLLAGERSWRKAQVISVKLRNVKPCAAPSVFHPLTQSVEMISLCRCASTIACVWLSFAGADCCCSVCELAPAKAILHPRWSFFPDNGKRLASRLAWERNTTTEP